MNTTGLQAYLHEQIPLTQAMEVKVAIIEPDSVVLSATLEPNINYCDTVFGGSAWPRAILSAWALLHTRLVNEGIESRLVIQRQTMSFDRAVAGEFTAASSLGHSDDWSRIRVNSVVIIVERIASRLGGDHVALQ